MERILVTGGAGFVGSHVCKALARAGFQPIVYDDLSRGHRSAVKWGPLIEGSLADGHCLRRALSTFAPTAVIHCAAFAYVGESVSDPLAYYANNAAGTLSLLQAMAEVGPRTFVLSSTCASYGVPQSVPIKETHPQNPINPYGWTKFIAERMLADLEPLGFRWVALRYFNAAGADPDGEIGEDHDPETHLIPLVLDAALGHVPSVTVFGTDYPTPDGTCVRDYIHVSDLADAHVRSLAYMANNGASGPLNLGNETGASVREIIDLAERITGRRVPVVEGPRRAGDPPILIGDATLARARLGWRPRRSALELIMQDAFRWRLQRDELRPLPSGADASSWSRLAT